MELFFQIGDRVETLLERQSGATQKGELAIFSETPVFFTDGASADDISSLKRELSEARERTKKTESEKEDLKTKTQELERKLEEMTKERKDLEEKTKQAKATETKKLLSAVTKLLLSSFPTDQVLN